MLKRVHNACTPTGHRNDRDDSVYEDERHQAHLHSSRLLPGRANDSDRWLRASCSVSLLPRGEDRSPGDRAYFGGATVAVAGAGVAAGLGAGVAGAAGVDAG